MPAARLKEAENRRRTDPQRVRQWQAATIALLFTGYAGYYFCRSDLSVAIPLIVEELGLHGVPAAEATVRLGSMVSLGVLGYAAGKFLLAGLADFLGGRRNFLGGMLGAILFTVIFCLGGGLPVFTLAWVANRFVQSLGWGGLVKIASRWFPYSAYGTVMGILSLSFLVGDAAARKVLGWLIAGGFGWRALFLAAAGALLAIFALNLLFLRESRTEIGAAEPEVNPLNVFGEEENAKPRSVGGLLRPLLGNPAFIVVLLLSLGCTLVRETFNTWTPTFLHAAGFSVAQAAGESAWFPLIGAVSVMAAGLASDRLGARGRAVVMSAGLLIATFALWGLGSVSGAASGRLAVELVGVVAFGLVGPYSYLAGAMALDFGGRTGGAMSSGLIDGVGYLGGALAGDTFARLAQAFGWASAFRLLGAVTAVSCLWAVALVWIQRRKAREVIPEPGR